MKAILSFLIFIATGYATAQQNHSIRLDCAVGNKIAASKLRECKHVEILGKPDAIIKSFEISWVGPNGLMSVFVQGNELSEPTNQLRNLKKGSKIFIEGVIAVDASKKKLNIKNAAFVID